MGVVLGAPENYLGLKEWGSRGTREFKQGKYDCVFYEIRKMVSLLLQGNPNVLSILWTQPRHHLYVSALGRRLIESRELFIGKHVYNAFAGYAHQQLEKMESRDPVELRLYLAITAELKFRGRHPNHKGETFPAPERNDGVARDVANWDTEKLLAENVRFQKKGENIGYLGDKRKRLVLENGYDSKNAAHLIRLLRMCKEFMATGEMVVFRPDAQELLDIKVGRWPLERVKRLATELFEECRAARDASTLPEEPRREEAQQLTVEILREHLGCVDANA
jgi:RNA repair pathway DNA polymerase beta family protein